MTRLEWDSLLFLTSEYKAQWCQFWHEMELESARQGKEWERQDQDEQAMRLEPVEMDLSDSA